MCGDYYYTYRMKKKTILNFLYSTLSNMQAGGTSTKKVSHMSVVFWDILHVVRTVVPADC